VVDAPGGGPVVLPARADRLDPASAALADGTPVAARAEGGGVVVELPARGADTAVAVGLDLR
jgi:alpha-L-fucosidase